MKPARHSVDLGFIFSTPGFEDFMRAASVGEGERNAPILQAEEDSLEKAHARAVIFR